MVGKMLRMFPEKGKRMNENKMDDMKSIKGPRAGKEMNRRHGEGGYATKPLKLGDRSQGKEDKI